MTTFATICEEMDGIIDKTIRLVTEPMSLAQIAYARVEQEIFSSMYRRFWWQYDEYMVGSIFEGIPFPFCNDFDLMMGLRIFPVVLWESQTKEEHQKCGYVMAEQNQREPVYLRLRAVDKQFLHEDVRSSIDDNGHLKSNMFMNSNISRLRNEVPVYPNVHIHGPSLASNVSFGWFPDRKIASKFDLVFCLKCHSWPSFATEFFKRERLNDWPCKELLENILGLECHVVAVGPRNSESKDKEWRLSFSVVERALIHKMPRPYAKCMYTLKAIIKHKFIVYSKYDKPTPFCSYFLKTACLWMCETLPQEGYSITDLIKRVLDWLIDKYQQKNLPHYFIPEQNLIGDLSNKHCDDVIKKLTTVKEDLWTIVMSSFQQFEIFHDEFMTSWSTACGYLKTMKVQIKNDDDFKTLVFHVAIKVLAMSIPLQVSELEYIAFRTFTNEDSISILINWVIKENYPVTEILRFAEEIMMPIVENIERIVPEGYEAFKTRSYRTLGDVYTYLLIYLREKCPQDVLALYRNKPLYYYRLGAEMVYPNKFSDQAIGGRALVVKYHYLMGNYEVLKETLRECKPIFITILENDDVINRVTYIHCNTKSLVAVNAWARDKEILKLAFCSYGGNLKINPVVFVFYVMATVYLKEGDINNASAILKKMKQCLAKTYNRKVNNSLIEIIELEILQVT